jgi:Myb-like DNA-binding domain
MKWNHELRRHTILKILKFDPVGGFNRGEKSVVSFNADDVLVCEYSVLEKLTAHDIEQFRTVVVDSRYPRGFLGSRWPSLPVTNPSKLHSLCTMIPVELLTKPFWERLVESAAKAPCDFLLVENVGEDTHFSESINMTEVQCAELTALRAALVLGARIFSSPTSSVLKRILTWGRRKARENVETTANIIKLVQGNLLDLTRPFCFESKQSLLEQISLQGQGPIDFEVRLCRLSPVEKQDYEKCSIALRGALSSDIVRCQGGCDVTRQTLRSMAEALLRMRKQCIHSRLSALFSKKPMQTRVGLCVGTGREKPNPSSPELEDGQLVCRNLEDNPSQTDLELASQILVGSAKLRELLSILRNECNCKVEGPAAFVSSPQPKAKKQSSFPKKVVILAVLPEVQILVSVLLHCVGIGHEFVKSPWIFSRRPYCDVKGDATGKRDAVAYLAWLECQEALARFNSPPTSGDVVAGRNILIASSEVIGCDHGGIGIDMADDDWSGRNELMIRSLVAGLCLRKRALKENCRFLSLVCEGTCEEIFLSVCSNETPLSAQRGEPHRSESWPWSIDARGRFLASMPTKFKSDSRRNVPLREEGEGVFAFPAQNVFRWRNRSLASILAVEKLPPCLDEGSSNVFLPCAVQNDPSSERLAEADFVVEMMSAEETASHAVNSCGEPPRQLFHFACTTAEDSPMDANNIILDNTPKQKRGDVSLSRMAEPQGRLATQTGHESAAAPQKSSPTTRRSHRDDARPVDTVACLLHYKPSKALLDHSHLNPCDIEPFAAEIDSSISAEQLLLHVPSRFASAFNLSKIPIDEDGRAGIEALVYLPPLAPGSLLRSTEAHDIFALGNGPETSEHDLDMGWLPHEPKRPADGTEDPEAKRFKGDLSIIPKFVDAHASATNPFDAAMANGNAPTLGPEAPIIPHNDFMSMDLDEDFESVGAPMGIAPLPNDSALLLSACLEVSNRSLDPDQLIFQYERPDGPYPCDAEEIEDLRTSQEGVSLDSVVLVVSSKRPNSSLPSGSMASYRASTHVEASRAGNGNHASVSNAIYGPSSSVVQELNGSFDPAVRTNNKVKSGTPTDYGSLAKAPLDIALQPGAMAQPAPHYQAAATTKARDLQKKGIFTFLSIGQKAMGRSMFESSQYRLAAVRFKNRTDDRMLRQSSALNASLKKDDAVHSFSAKVEAGVIDGPAPSGQRSSTGDGTESCAGRQLNFRHLSLQTPCLVDFGPFNGGFLQSSSRISGSWPPMPKVGVSLPMGVKVQHAQRPQHPRQQRRAWTKIEDRKLQSCVARFGLNWTLASRTLSDFDGSVDVNGSVHFPRTARECRQRWEEIALNDHSLDVELRKSGGAESPGLSSASPETACETSLLLSLKPQGESVAGRHDATEPSMSLLGFFEPERKHPPMKKAEPNKTADPSGTNELSPEKLPERAFGSVSSAYAKRRVVPITIPGSTPGSQPAFVASHPSHLDAVHSSIAASWTSGRTEMWPLQFLDVAEKQRTARVSAAATASSSAISQSSSHAVSPVGSSASITPEGSARAPAPASAARPAPTNHHPMAPSNSAVFGHHPLLSQPYPNAHNALPPRQAGAYPPHLAPPSAARSAHHRMEPPQPKINAPRGSAPPMHGLPPPKAVVAASSNHIEKPPVPKEQSPTNAAPRQGTGRTTGSDDPKSPSQQT